MKTYRISLINAMLLILLGLWGYLASSSPSLTAFIPVVAGVILILLNSGVKNENKILSHIAVIITLVVLIGLIKPFMGAMDRSSSEGMLRVGIMLISTLVAMVFFIRSFVSARKK